MVMITTIQLSVGWYNMVYNSNFVSTKLKEIRRSPKEGLRAIYKYKRYLTPTAEPWGYISRPIPIRASRVYQFLSLLESGDPIVVARIARAYTARILPSPLRKDIWLSSDTVVLDINLDENRIILIFFNNKTNHSYVFYLTVEYVLRALQTEYKWIGIRIKEYEYIIKTFCNSKWG